MTRRRSLLVLAASSWAARAWAHHGWDAYDTRQPLYIEGPVTTLMWADPHPHLELLHRPGYALPMDLADRDIPAQRAPFDARAVLRRAVVPAGSEARWRVDLPELNRLIAWDLARPKIGMRLGVVGYAGPPVTGTPTMVAEILFIGERAYPMRSDPA
jgi:hypothetical protein